MNLLDFVFPKICLGCGNEGSYICSDCVAKVRPAKLICPYCERPSIDGVTHIKCQKKLGLSGLISIWEYEGVIRKAILALKYKYVTEIALLLSDYIIEQFQISNIKSQISNLSVLVPVPLHWHRQNTRGFNQSIEVGKSVADAMNWKFAPVLLVKKQPTISQVELRGDRRRQNLKGVFALSPHDSLFIIPDSVVLFDDIFTTGSTLREAAKVLKKAGVRKVWGLTVAR
jgi:ComF family protein